MEKHNIHEIINSAHFGSTPEEKLTDEEKEFVTKTIVDLLCLFPVCSDQALTKTL